MRPLAWLLVIAGVLIIIARPIYASVDSPQPAVGPHDRS